MGTYIVRRVLLMVPVLFIVTVLAFSVTMLLPGDPALAILGVEGARNEQAYQALRQELGLDQPVPVQYVRWLGRTMHGDFGRSALNHQPVADAIWQRLPVTLELGVLSLVMSIVLAVPLGIYAAVHHDTVFDLVISLVSFAGIAMPGFWLAILLIYLLTLDFNLLPATGFVPLNESLVGNLRYLAMPVFTLGIESTAGLMRQVRSAMLEVLGEDYIRTARAKGIAEPRVVWVHAFRSCLLPVVTIIGMRIGRLLGGAVVVEMVFALPGIGRLAVDSIFNRDFPVIQTVVLLVALAVLLSNLITDLVYGYVDPRIRYG
jgi:peptide/nickel transport system permease protein